ncbi:hypothetical protein FALCPG4_014847 [Fusarium falciforme]
MTTILMPSTYQPSALLPPHAQVMASLSSAESVEDIFSLSQIATSIAATETPMFLQEHGFFYQEDAKIGELVSGLYERLYGGKLQRDEIARFGYFKSTLREDLRVNTILDHYPHRARQFAFPWGGVQQTYYSWGNPSEKADGAVIVYMLGPGLQGKCLDKSHRRTFDVEAAKDGSFHLPDEYLGGFTPREIKMTEGGM